MYHNDAIPLQYHDDHPDGFQNTHRIRCSHSWILENIAGTPACWQINEM